MAHDFHMYRKRQRLQLVLLFSLFQTHCKSSARLFVAERAEWLRQRCGHLREKKSTESQITPQHPYDVWNNEKDKLASPTSWKPWSHLEFWLLIKAGGWFSCWGSWGCKVFCSLFGWSVTLRSSAITHFLWGSFCSSVSDYYFQGQPSCL